MKGKPRFHLLLLATTSVSCTAQLTALDDELLITFLGLALAAPRSTQAEHCQALYGSGSLDGAMLVHRKVMLQWRDF